MSNIPKPKLEILNNIPNVLDYSQSTIDSYLIDDYNRENIVRSIKLLLHRLNHVSVDFLGKKLETRFSDIDFVNLVKYPLPASYNVKTKRVVVNMKFFGKKEVTNIDPHMLVSGIFYGYMCRLFTERPLRPESQIEVSDFMSELLIKVFGSKYGIMVSYADMIPKLRFVVISYILTSFYGTDQKKSYIKANRSGTSSKKFVVKFDDFDLYNVRNFINLLSESKVFPGINIAEFAGTIMNRYGLIMLPLFEDEMRFMATLAAATLPNGGLFPPYLESTNAKLHSKIISNITQYI